MNWDKYLNDSRLRDSGRDRTDDSRNEFESDYGRVIFSPALRRMHDKTQVMPLTTDDNIHSRLTHSLEVMAVAYSLGIRLVENQRFLEATGRKPEQLLRSIPLILQSAAAVHDVGNPPFGHFGEESIKSFFQDYFARFPFPLTTEQKEDFTSFDGNAQGFRILTKLQVLDDPFGLNLTKAMLASYMKYPNSGRIDKAKIGQRKRGVFQSEVTYLSTIADDCGMNVNGGVIRHPLAFLVEAADNICYSAMDIEDGYNKGWYNFEDILLDFQDSEIIDKLRKINIEKKSASAKIIGFRLLVISTLSARCIDRFIENLPQICQGTYNSELTADGGNLDSVLKRFCKTRIFSNREIVSLELTGDAVIKGLLSMYTKFLLESDGNYLRRMLPLISKSLIKAVFLENNLNERTTTFEDLDVYYKLRIIVDYISGMTDQYALSQYQRLNGQKIN